MAALRRLVLVRHGETVGQSSIRYYGCTDVGLNDAGRRQMQRVGRALASEVFDAVYTSALRRTVDGARLIAPQHEPRIVADFNEVSFGRWEGLTREEIAARDPERFARWQAALHEFTYPEGDAVLAFRRRVATAWRALYPLAPERLLVVAHKGVIRTILAELLRLDGAEPRAWRIDLASIHELRAGDAGWITERVNDLRHLEGLP
jgi:broad specificity phosphatase PhoE